MDIAKFKYNCPKHPDFKIEFLQVDNFSRNKDDQKLFYCSCCVDQDSDYKHSNYQLIKHIIKNGTDQILPKWPPVNDINLLKQLIELCKGKEEKQSITSEIEKYFADLKDSILKQIDICQKNMIQQAQKLPQNMNEILKRYQSLSKINELRSFLLDNKTDIHEKERQYRALINNIYLQKKTITEQLASLLDDHIKQQIYFSSESALEMKESILMSISRIKFFEQPNIQVNNEMINKQNTNQQQLDVQLFTSSYDDGNKHTEVRKIDNNQYQLYIKEYTGNWFNTISKMCLEIDKKYIFRIKIEIEMNQSCYVGLISNPNINCQPGCRDNLSCNLNLKGNTICLESDYGISQQMKGKGFNLSQENIIEMRVCLKEQILEVLDYPNYYYKLALQNQYKPDLIKKKNLRLYLGLWNQFNIMTLNEVFTIDKFID